MTPKGIELGRQFDARSFAVEVTSSTTVSVVAADANRVALSVALRTADLTTFTGPVAICARIGTTDVALSALTEGHPACYLSVDKIGSALFAPIVAVNPNADNATIGVTVVRQVQELPTWVS